ncbi:MAG: ATP-binding cassette domain-containing protein [Limimaricola sp.]|uniref:ABC transporter ATP-binding protein n=1 Tax=Limimaricola sp. TaxID=2211665 RepID=UPI001D8D6E06|nr:oligopeptide/dipeptide ABC transporter ATP-binding protein [Limimaricola sp.]MBI1416832.1 ATP-binding cassette domain-containing protein [Limimaricola sp.]
MPIDAPGAGAPSETLLRVSNLKKHFPIRGGLFGQPAVAVKAIDDISFDIGRGEVVGLVGESGSGKTTVGRTILRLTEPTSGQILFDGQDIAALTPQQMRAQRKRMQIVFQDPDASLNPRETIRQAIGRALRLHNIGTRGEREGRIVDLLEQVGLSGDYIDRYPHEFSGGQRQRIGIARALAVEPEFIVADEPVSALDVSVQAQVINLMEDLTQRLNLTMLFIAHDLAVVEHISNRVIVMYLGKIMEIAPSSTLYAAPRHPYTRALMSAVPRPDPTFKRQRVLLQGDIPSPINPPSGCVFRSRCPVAGPECAGNVPALEQIGEGHFSACIKNHEFA